MEQSESLFNLENKGNNKIIQNSIYAYVKMLKK